MMSPLSFVGYPPLAACFKRPASTDHPAAGKPVFLKPRHPLVVLPSNSSFHPAACSADVSVACSRGVTAVMVALDDRPKPYRTNAPKRRDRQAPTSTAHAKSTHANPLGAEATTERFGRSRLAASVTPRPSTRGACYVPRLSDKPSTESVEARAIRPRAAPPDSVSGAAVFRRLPRSLQRRVCGAADERGARLFRQRLRLWRRHLFHRATSCSRCPATWCSRASVRGCGSRASRSSGAWCRWR